MTVIFKDRAGFCSEILSQSQMKFKKIKLSQSLRKFESV